VRKLILQIQVHANYSEISSAGPDLEGVAGLSFAFRSSGQDSALSDREPPNHAGAHVPSLPRPSSHYANGNESTDGPSLDHVQTRWCKRVDWKSPARNVKTEIGRHATSFLRVLPFWALQGPALPLLGSRFGRKAGLHLGEESAIGLTIESLSERSDLNGVVSLTTPDLGLRTEN